MRRKCFIITLILALNVLLPSVYATVSTEENVVELLNLDFENDSSRASGTVGSVVKVSDTNKNYGNVLKLGGNGASATAFFGFNRNAGEGLVSISYDMYYPQRNAESYVRVFRNIHTAPTSESEKDMAEAYIVRNNGDFQLFNKMEWNVDSTPTMRYEAEQWYHIDMWFDFNKRIASYYIDGEILGSTPMADDIDKIGSFYHVMTGMGECRIDNVYAMQFIGGGIDMSKYAQIKGYPPTITQKVMTEVELTELGHAYFTKTITGKAKLCNTQNQAFSGKLVVKAFGEEGAATVNELSVVLDANEKKDVNFTFKVERYGFYDLVIDCVDSNGAIYGNASTRFSSIILNETPNPRQAFASHLANGQQGYGFDKRVEKLAYAKKAGSWTMRDEIRWTSVEEEKGIMKMDQWIEGAIDAAQKNDMRIFLILGYGHPQLYPEEPFPKSPEVLKEFIDYVEYVATATKGMKIDFEVWNEYNHQPKERYGTDEQDYVNLLKAVYEKVKSINPEAKVYAFNTSNSVTNIPAAEFIETCLSLGAGEYMDGITIHPYNIKLAPEEKFVDDINLVIDVMNKYGVGDKDIVVSEFGWTSSQDYLDEERQTNYVPQASAIMPEKVSRVMWYNLQEKTKPGVTDAELHFGFVRGWTNTEIPFEAKPVMLSFSAYNALMNGAKNTGKIEMVNENASVYTFKTKDNKDSLMAWSKNGNIQTALNVGAEYVTVYDRFGNGQEIATRNGVLDIQLTERPVYIFGEIGQVHEASPSFRIMQNKIITTEDDNIVISGIAPSPEYSFDVECPDNIVLEQETSFTDLNSFQIKLKAGTNSRENEAIVVNVKDKNTGKTVYTQTLDVTYVPRITVESSVKYYKNLHWQLILKLKSNRTQGYISGKVKISNPQGLSLSKNSSEFNRMAPGETRYVYINIPLKDSMDKLDIKGCVELDDGTVIPFEESSYFVGLMKARKAPTVDGRIDKFEYSTEAPVRADKAEMIQGITDWGGVSDLSGTVYLNYDSQYFYLAAKVRDNVEGAEGNAAKVWANDSIQFAFAEYATTTAERTEIGIGKDNQGNPAIYRYSFLGKKFIIADDTTVIPFEDTCEVKIGRDGDMTIYEARVPWVDIYGDQCSVFNKKEILFSIIINDNDGAGRRGWIEFCPGIGNTKSAALFMKVPVMQ